jgi:hypothetical protein
VSFATKLHRLVQKLEKLQWEEVKQVRGAMSSAAAPGAVPAGLQNTKWLLLNFCLPNLMQILTEVNSN